ncbi:MAG: alpha-galactosidase [Alphaproteobacteria bacterium]|jgi:alpha-galactosidase|nr:alpha-galactosidase [Alphaproteobacteria bacterium]
MSPLLRIGLWVVVVLTAISPLRSADAAAESGFEGQWTGEQANSDQPAPTAAILIFTQGAGALTGILRMDADELPLFDVKESGTSLSFTLVIPGSPYVSVHYAGARAGDEIRLVSSEEGHGIFTMTAHRDGQTQTASLQPVIPSAALAPPPIGDTASALPRVLEGRWAAQQASPGSAAPIEAALVFTGNRGTMHVGADDWPLFDVKETGTSIAFTLVIPGAPYVTIHYSGVLTGDGLELASLDEGQGIFTLTARRAGSMEAPLASTLAPSLVPALPGRNEPPVALLTPPPPPPEAFPAPPRALPAVPMVPTPSASSSREVAPNNLAQTPPMGWASREKLGTDIDDDVIRQAAEGLDEAGLRTAGYVTVEIDDGWQGMRDAKGALRGNEKFPDMKALGDYIHSKGLKFGLQTSAVAKSCNGFEGSLGHEAQDAETFASWGVDYLIYDMCGADGIYGTRAEQRAAFEKMAAALRASGREIALAISQNGAFDVAQWGAKTGANLWRTGRDLEPDWQSITEAGFGQNGKEAFAGPGHWNDPGLLQTGNGAMTPDEYRTQLNLWAVLAAPFMLGNDVRIMTRETVSALTNAEVIAIDQDPLGRQGKRVSQNGATEVWARPLADGSTAAAFFNRGDQSAAVAVSWQQLGIDGPRHVRDLWWHQNLSTANQRYVVFLTPHTSLLVRMSP